MEGHEGRKIHDVPGYGTVDMDAPGWRVDGQALRTLMGYHGVAHHPNTTSGPAVNEPHTPVKQTVVGRRAEDLSGPEHAKATAVLKAYGTSVPRAAQHLVDSHDRAVTRSILAGSTQIAGSGFYGGPSEPHRVMSDTKQAVMGHSKFKGTEEDAWAVTSVANSLTSPKAPFDIQKKDGSKIFPSAAAADTAVSHALSGKPASAVPKAPHGGIHKNTVKAAATTARMLLPESHPEHQTVRTAFSWSDNPKTSAYVSAHTNASTADSYGVSDVHSTRSMAPHLPYAKSVGFTVHDKTGAPVMKGIGDKQVPVTHYYEAEDVRANGLPDPKLARQRLKHHELAGHTYQPRTTDRDDSGSGKQRPVWGGSAVEGMLSQGGAPVHALLDHSRRIAAHQLGMTPSVNHAQAQNQLQETDWRDQQILRPDMPQSMATEYPGHHERMGYPSEEFHVSKPETWPHMGPQFAKG